VVNAQISEHSLTPHERAALRRLHDASDARMLPHTLTSAAYFALMAAAIGAWSAGHWVLLLALWAAGAHIGHHKLIAFHEAAHATLNSRRWINELQGICMGTIIFVPLSVYRYVHAQHHAYLGSPRDLELWPFADPGASRGLRLACAAAELTLGFFYTPVVFAHGVLASAQLPPGQARRIVVEYGICLVFWTALLTWVSVAGFWPELAVGYFVPAALAGNLQSLRKFTEHMGLFGDGILTITRTVVDRRWLGRMMSDSMLHIDYHGTHHRYARLPYYHLPEATPYVYRPGTSALPLFPSYLAAMRDMLSGLADPRVGRQWLEGAP
jgi:fatty acid desaturase